MLGQLKSIISSIITYGMLVAIIWAGMYYLPRIRSVVVPLDYGDINGLEASKSYWLDGGARVNTMKDGEGIAFNFTTDAEQARFGWVAGRPGQSIEVNGGKLLVDGRPAAKGGDISGADLGPLVVPAGHVWLVSSGHRHDSFRYGPIPQSAILGSVGDLP